jgi:hypothetical protein
MEGQAISGFIMGTVAKRKHAANHQSLSWLLQENINVVG